MPTVYSMYPTPPTISTASDIDWHPDLIARTSCTAIKSAPWWWRPETLPRTRTATVNHGLQATPGSPEDHRRWQGGGMVRLAQPADT